MIWSVLFIIFVHWVSDFVLQTHHMSTRKSSSNYYLTMHVIVYAFSTIVLWALVFPLLGIHLSSGPVWLAFLLIFVTHWITDYFTSRRTSKLYKEEKYHDFFVVIGFDQVLHYTQLLLIFNYIILNQSI
jgi:membrane-bound metal-dependent hydrolase YbcI (DUF457 family)